MEASRQNSKKVFFSGVLLLSVSTLLVKVIGLIYKIPMLSFLGSEGMGYFNSAYEIYTLFCIIATAGLPVALSILISSAVEKGDEKNVNRIFHLALRIFICFGLLGCGIMWIFAKQFCKWIQSENAYAAILSIAPTIFFVCVSSAIRGYFQGFQRMLPTAVSQLIESGGKLVLGLIFASLALRGGYSTEIVAAAAGWGLSAGTALSTLYLIILKARFHEKGRMKSSAVSITNISNRETEKGILSSLLSLALPMTLGASLTSVTKLIDMAMILRGLQKIGYTEITANESYGSYTTLALSVFTLLPTLLNSISLPLVPILSASITAKNTEKQRQMIETSYRLTAFFAIPASLGIALFSHPILSLIFKNQEESVNLAAPLLSLLGISVFLSCMITVTNSILHAYRVVKRPILSLAVGAIIKIILAYLLIGNPKIGLIGAPISSCFCNATIVIMNFFFASRFSKSLSIGKIFFLPLINGGISIGFSFLCYQYFSRHYNTGDLLTLFSCLLSVLLYFFLSFLSGAFRSSDISMLPFGERLCDLIERIKYKLFKENKQKSDD